MAEYGDGTLEPPPYATIDTDRLHLRTLLVSDAEAIMSILSSEGVMKWTSSGRPLTTADQAKRWLKDRALGQDVFNFAVYLRPEPSTTQELNEPQHLIGIAGSFHWPSVGYLVHPDYAGKGYATEALQALTPRLFERMPPASKGGVGCDYIEASTDSENWASRRVLDKCGFTYCETRLKDFENPALGLRDTSVFRIPRPGKTLEELRPLMPKKPGVASGAIDEGFVPPIQ
ncbi:hypothetical protein LTR36_008642 [Oleoguttula mirabilis]|uniref:N-acetyltransferase domain-containing protein n=1 Tax=Oleoguttula mirabilis TaxID=1507867 RepID=A0AAV9JTM0_9PEZI|nr:hypothetical protein LTR36_008642 [Oleoguttula mirabilis]